MITSGIETCCLCGGTWIVANEPQGDSLCPGCSSPPPVDPDRQTAPWIPEQRVVMAA